MKCDEDDQLATTRRLAAMDRLVDRAAEAMRDALTDRTVPPDVRIRRARFLFAHLWDDIEAIAPGSLGMRTKGTAGRP